MKKLSWLLAAALPIALMFSCQKQIASSSDGSETGLRSPKPKAAYTATSCSEHCIDPSNPVYYELSGTAAGSIGGNAKSISYTVYNTLTEFKVVLGYERLPTTSGSSSSIKVTVGASTQYACIANHGSTTLTFTLATASPGWTGCTPLAWSIVEENHDVCTFDGGVISKSDTYKLVPACTSGCTIEGNEFHGLAVSCGTSREAVYTFGSEDGVSYFKMQGGLTNFTGGNADVYINGTLVVFNTTSDDGWATGTVAGITVGQRTPGGSSNRNIRVVGSAGECSSVLVRILWNSSNSGGVITGGWSVVDAGGVELAPPVAGLTCE